MDAHVLERLSQLGEEQLADAELVALLLGTRQAQALLDDCGGLAGVARAGLRGLQRTRGVGRMRAARLRAALELGRRAVAATAPPLTSLMTTSDVVAYFQPRLAGLSHERLYVVLLDARNRAFRIELVARGGLTGVSVHAREILLPAIREQAAAIVMVHNHPSGDPTPSECDRELTRRVRAAGEMVGIPLLDHVVIARGGSESV